MQNSAMSGSEASTQSLAISVAQGTRPGVVSIQLTNAGSGALAVLSHVEAARPLLTWYRLDVSGLAGTRRLSLGGPANESVAITSNLSQGAWLRHDVDVQAAALEPHNGATRLSPGTYQIIATYAVTEPGTHWTGSISSPPVTVAIP